MNPVNVSSITATYSVLDVHHLRLGERFCDQVLSEKHLLKCICTHVLRVFGCEPLMSGG